MPSVLFDDQMVETSGLHTMKIREYISMAGHEQSSEVDDAMTAAHNNGRTLENAENARLEEHLAVAQTGFRLSQVVSDAVRVDSDDFFAWQPGLS